jgi:hypothetical protein
VIKIINWNDRKWLLRLSQTALEVGTASHFCAFVTYTPFGVSRLQSLLILVRKQERGKSERRSIMERIGFETSPHAKAGIHPHGLSSQESLQNHHYGRKANGRCNTGVCTFWRDMERYPLGCFVQRQVRRLLARIVKAAQDGRHDKAKALQSLLTHSFSSKALAVKRVTENKGKNITYVDKVTWKTPGTKTNAVASLKRRGYSSLPLRRVLIPKKNGKTKPLGIPAMKCRAMQALYLLALEPIAETKAAPNSYGYRSQRSTSDLSLRVRAAQSKKAKIKLQIHIT